MSRRAGLRTPSPYARAVAVIAVLLVVGAVVGVVLSRHDRRTVPADSHSDTSIGAADHGATEAGAPTGPSSEAAGIPAGFSADEPGAVAAAVAYATASQRWLYLSDEPPWVRWRLLSLESWSHATGEGSGEADDASVQR